MPRILIIDDDHQVRNLLRVLLTRSGYEVDSAEDGDKGLEALAKTPADLVITDMLMPGHREGLEVVAEAKRLCPSASIFALSGGGRLSPDKYLDLALEFGAEFADDGHLRLHLVHQP